MVKQGGYGRHFSQENIMGLAAFNLMRKRQSEAEKQKEALEPVTKIEEKLVKRRGRKPKSAYAEDK